MSALEQRSASTLRDLVVSAIIPEAGIALGVIGVAISPEPVPFEVARVSSGGLMRDTNVVAALAYFAPGRGCFVS